MSNSERELKHKIAQMLGGEIVEDFDFEDDDDYGGELLGGACKSCLMENDNVYFGRGMVGGGRPKKLTDTELKKELHKKTKPQLHKLVKTVVSESPYNVLKNISKVKKADLVDIIVKNRELFKKHISKAVQQSKQQKPTKKQQKPTKIPKSIQDKINKATTKKELLDIKKKFGTKKPKKQMSEADKKALVQRLKEGKRKAEARRALGRKPTIKLTQFDDDDDEIQGEGFFKTLGNVFKTVAPFVPLLL